MKNLKLTIITFSIVIGLAGCASQKEVQNSADEPSANNTYTSNNTESATMAEPTSETIIKTEPAIHIVQKGESLWVIAQKYGLTVSALAETNTIKNKNLIKINQELIIPVAKGKLSSKED